MVIEFIGTPGAGKTTLLPIVAEYLQERGIRARSVVEAARPYAQRTFLGRAVSRLVPQSLRRPLLWQVFYYLSALYRLRFFTKHPRLIRQVLSSQKRRPIPVDARRHVTYWFFHLVGCYEFLTAHACPDEALILDEGFVHRVVQMNASDVEEPDPAQIVAYVDLLPRPDLVIAVLSPLEVCEKRIYRRGIWKRFEHKSPAEVSRYLANSHRVVDLTVDYIRSKGWNVIEVDNWGEELAALRAEFRSKLTMTPASACEMPRSEQTPERELTMVQQHRIVHLPRPSRLSWYISARLRPPDIEIDTLREALKQYGLEPVRPPRNLPVGRRNRNVEVDTHAGKKLLKGYRPQWQVGTVRYAHSILTRLAQLDFPAPRLVAALNGETFVAMAGLHYALFDFADGVDYTAKFLLRIHRLKLMADAGCALACLHRQLKGFMPEGYHHMGFRAYTGSRWRDMAWHVDKVDDLKERSSRLTGSEERTHVDWLIQNSSYIIEELGRLDERLSVAQLPRLVIHGDYGLHNLLFSKDGVVMPLDFELARLEWRLSDLVSCLSRLRYSKRGEVAYDFESMHWFMEGYQSEYPLSGDEWQLLPQVWRFYKMQGAVQYWNSYFQTRGPTRKLVSARDAMNQADWALSHPDRLLQLNARPTSSFAIGSNEPSRASDLHGPG